MKRFLLVATSATVVLGCTTEAEVRWFRGNLHTHTLWSDGNQFPEVIVSWYVERGYDFVSISDHNTIGDGDQWVALTSAERRLAASMFRERFPNIIQERDDDSVMSVRLTPFAEYRAQFHNDSFLLLLGEEITSQFERRPLHVNATNIVNFIPPVEGGSVVEVLQRTVDAVLDQRAATGQPMFPHVNHPNFGWAVTVEDLLALRGERFFELYNGHPLVNNEGDSLRPSTERMWDIILADHIAAGREPMYGIAVDDSHHYLEFSPTRVNPGRGWVSVRADTLTAEAIIEAMERGEFYASSGVTVTDITADGNALTLELTAEPGVRLVTEFIGTRIDFDTTTVDQPPVEGLPASRRYSNDIGVVLAREEGLSPSYAFAGDELYVRARVTSDKLKENPYRVGEFERAWTQPVVRFRPEN